MIRRVINSTLDWFGYRLIRPEYNQPQYGLEVFFSQLKRFGFGPSHILDIGANVGNWTREAVKHFPSAHYTLVEPQDELKIHVQDLVDAGYRINWINAGASDQPGILPLTIQGRHDSSTFRKITNGLSQISVQVRTVNEIVESTGLPIPEIVKIDAEGFDLKVFAGASELVGKTEIFLAEAAIFPNGMENTALALIKMMADAGYRIMDITDINRSPQYGALWLCEFAFLRETSQLFDQVTRYSEDVV